MKYKAEVVKNARIVSEFYYKDKSHPNQVARSVTQSLKNRNIEDFMIYIVNDVGDLWRFTVLKGPDNKFYVRPMEKAKEMLNRNEIDMIFTGNKKIWG